VVQGERDAFGVPAPSPGVDVHVVPGADHGFAVRRRDGRTAADVREEVERVVRAWLVLRLGEPGQTLT
jgi:dienelactone hydrolase